MEGDSEKVIVACANLPKLVLLSINKYKSISPVPIVLYTFIVFEISDSLKLIVFVFPLLIFLFCS